MRAAAKAKKATKAAARKAKSVTHRVKHEPDIHVGHKTTGHEHKVNAPKGF